MSDTRICKKCGINKPLLEFNKHRSCVGGRSHTCRVCQKSIAHERYINNIELFKLRGKLRREKNKEKTKAKYYENRGYYKKKLKESYEKHKEKRKLAARKSYYKNREQRIEHSIKYAKKNRLKIYKKSSEWRKKNPEKVKNHWLKQLPGTKEKSKHNIANLTDTYVRTRLTENGFPKEAITNDLIEIKRIQLKIIRKIKNHGKDKTKTS